jgi:hypothetical protein
MSRQNEWQKKKRAEGLKPIRPLLTPEANAALERLKATGKTTQSIVNKAIIALDYLEREYSHDLNRHA